MFSLCLSTCTSCPTLRLRNGQLQQRSRVRKSAGFAVRNASIGIDQLVSIVPPDPQGPRAKGNFGTLLWGGVSNDVCCDACATVAAQVARSHSPVSLPRLATAGRIVVAVVAVAAAVIVVVVVVVVAVLSSLRGRRCVVVAALSLRCRRFAVVASLSLFRCRRFAVVASLSSLSPLSLLSSLSPLSPPPSPPPPASRSLWL